MLKPIHPMILVTLLAMFIASSSRGTENELSYIRPAPKKWLVYQHTGYKKLGFDHKWYDLQGRELDAKLLKVDEKNIYVEAKNRKHVIPIDQLSISCKEYVEPLMPKPPIGEIHDFVHPGMDYKKELRNSLHLKSLEWQGYPRALSYDETELMLYKVPFLLYVPPMSKNKRQEKIPLLVHLHGTGGIGYDNERQLEDGNGVALKLMGDFLQRNQPFYVMLPQIEIQTWANGDFRHASPRLKGVVHAIKLLGENPEYNIDRERIYITGLSMGGRGVSEGLYKFPGFFCGGTIMSWAGGVDYYNRYNAGNMWIVINRNDHKFFERSEKVKATYKRLGLSHMLDVTVYDQPGHDAWTRLMGEKKFRQWLSKKPNNQKSTSALDSLN